MFAAIRFCQFSPWVAWTVLLGLASWAPAQQPDDATKPKRPFAVHGIQPDAASRWIGVSCEPVPDALRAHVDLKEGQGLMVTKVMPGSPAEKAGLAVHDILLKVNGDPLKSRESLIQAVSDAGEQGVQLEWLHKGETRTQAVRPVKRPEQLAPAIPGLDFKAKELKLTRPFHMRFFGPAFEMPAHAKKDFPKDLKLEIRKEGPEPARIVVQKGDQKWEITDQDLDQLPDDVRPYVERFAGADVLIHLPRIPESMTLPKIDSMDKESAMEYFGRPETREFFRKLAPFDIEDRLNRIDRRMDQLRQELRQLRGADANEADDAAGDAPSDDAEARDAP